MEIHRLRIFSDLHLEFFDWTPPPVAADAIVLAGGDACVLGDTCFLGTVELP
jgi:hypothetical protein